MDSRKLRPLQLALRAAAGASTAFAAARFLELDRPIIAFTAAVIATDLFPAQSRELGLRRLGATVLGGVVGATLGSLLQSNPWTLGVGVLVAMLLAHLLRASEAARVAGYICGLIVIDSSDAPWRDALHRMIETALGVSVAWIISYVPKLISITDAETTSNDAGQGQHSKPEDSDKSAADGRTLEKSQNTP